MLKNDNKKRHIVIVGKGGGGGGTQVQSDWAQTDNTQPDYIKNKPEILDNTWFGTQAEFDALVGKNPNIIYYIEDANGSVVHNNKNYGTKVKIEKVDTLISTYFYVEDVSGSDNTLSIGRGGNAPAIEVFASTDQINWTSMGTTRTDRPLTATIPADGKLYLKANTTTWANGWDNNNGIRTSSDANVGGNIMSLLNGDNFINSGFAPNSSNNFLTIFRDFYTLISASELQLPATELTNGCYAFMFALCGVRTAPVLPATTLVENCYNNMFSSSRVRKVVTYAQDISAENCISGWLGNVSGTGNFYNLGGATYPSGESGIPSGWTEHTSL